MKIYVAARLKSKDTVLRMYAALEARGHEITNKWTDQAGATNYGNNLELTRHWIEADLTGVSSAEVVIFLAEYEADARGGHVEFGYALKESESRPLKIFVIFERDNPSMFYHHPNVVLTDSFEKVLVSL